MNSAQISYDELSEIVEIRVSNNSIFTNSRIFMFLSRMNAEMSGDTALFKCSSDKLQSAYSQLERLLESSSIELLIDKSAGNQLEIIKQREVDFAEFTDSARSIWERKYEPEWLGKFEEILRASIQRKLTNYQFMSALHLAFSQNACNFSVPGAGKTTIVYSAYSYLNKIDGNKHIDRLFVIGPLASFYAWKTEFNKCFGYDPKLYRILGGSDSKEIKSVLSGTSAEYINLDFIHSSFQSASNYKNEIKKYLSDSRFKTMLVIDEAHNIKKENGTWSTACLEIADCANARVVLTGTPAPNGYEDIYNLFKILYPKKNIIGFERANLLAMSSGAMSAANMLEKIKPFFTRVTKSHLKLPPAYENKIELDLSPIEKCIYSAVEDIFLGDRFGDSESKVLKAKVIRLRQASSNPEMLLLPLEDVQVEIDQDSSELIKMIKLFSFSDSSKVYALFDICDSIISEGKKVLIWSYFIKTIDSLVPLLHQKYGCTVHKVTGSTPSELNSEISENEIAELTREKIIKEFNEGHGPQILVANPQALGESVSLHYDCHDAIYFDRDFNCGRFIQSKDRIHRYGLAENTITNYWYLLASGTIDYIVDKRLTEKEARMNEIVEKEEIPLFKGLDSDDLSDDDFMQILKYYDQRKLL